MKILYVVHQFFPKYYTGTEKFVLNLSKQMQRMGHNVKVLTYGISEEDSSFEKTLGEFLVKRYIYNNIEVVSLRHKVIPSDINFKIFYPNLENILEKVFPEKFDIVHIAHPMRLCPIIRYCIRNEIPTVLTLTDFWLACPKGVLVTNANELCIDPAQGSNCVKMCYGRLWEKDILQRYKEAKDFIDHVDSIISPTNFLANIMKNIFNKRIKVIRHGIDYSNIRLYKTKDKKEKIFIGYIGSILPHKGVHIALEAVKFSNAKNIELKIYGSYFHEIEYFRTLKNLAENDPRIKFMGEYKESDLNMIMNELDFTIQPSLWWENSPLTILTSLAYRVPVITTNVGGAAELIKDGLNGFNFEIGNPKSLAEIIDMISENPNIIDKLKKNITGPPRVEEEAFEYENIYENII